MTIYLKSTYTEYIVIQDRGRFDTNLNVDRYNQSNNSLRVTKGNEYIHFSGAIVDKLIHEILCQSPKWYLDGLKFDIDDILQRRK